MLSRFHSNDSSVSITTSATTRPIIAVLKQQGYLAAGIDNIEIYDLYSKLLMRTIQTSSIVWDLKPFQEDKVIQASGGGKIRIWNVETGDLVTTLEGHSGKDVYGIALNKNETLMLSGGQDDNVILWDMVNFTQLRIFNGHTHWVRSVVFNEPKNQVISGSYDNTIRIWDMDDGSLVRELTGHLHWVSKIVLDEKTGLLYSASDDTTIKVWNVESGQCLKTLQDHTTEVYDLILSQEGDWLASTAHDESIIIWDKHTGSSIYKLNYMERLYSLALNPLTDQLLSSSESGKIVFWN